MFLSNNFCTSFTFEAKGLVRKHQAKFLLYLPFRLSPGRWEVQTVTTSNSSCTFGGKQSLLKYVGNQLPGMCRSLFLRLSCLVWLIFFLLATCSESQLWPHTGGGDPALRSRVTLQCVHIFGPFVRWEDSSGSHLVAGISKAPSSWPAIANVAT